MKLNKIVSIKAIKIGTSLKQTAIELKDLIKAETIGGEWFSGIESGGLTKNVGISKSNLCLIRSNYTNKHIIATNQVNFITSSIINRANLQSGSRKLVCILPNQAFDESSIDNDNHLNILKTATSIKNIIGGMAMKDESLFEAIIKGVTNKTNLNRLIRATISLSLANHLRIN